MALSFTCDRVPGISVGVCTASKSHLSYIDNPCEIIITENSYFETQTEKIENSAKPINT